MIKKGFHSVFLLLFCLQVHCQSRADSLAVNFKLEFNKLPLEPNKDYVSSNKDTLSIETFRCYVSDIRIEYENHAIFIQKNSYRLLDLDHPESFRIPITKITDSRVTKVTFNIGIDSITNTSGAMAGALDPAKGMYWAWQSGYINMKIEGKSPSCKTRKNEFQLHIGGYLEPYYALRKIEIPIIQSKDSDEIGVAIDLKKLFDEIHLKEQNSIMIPGKEAMKIADLSAKLFSAE